MLHCLVTISNWNRVTQDAYELAISYVLSCLKENSTQVRNIKQYLLAALYNAPLTISNYYQAMYNNDHANGLV